MVELSALSLIPSAVPGAKEICSAFDVGVVMEGAGEGEGDAGDMLPTACDMDEGGVATVFEALERGEADTEEIESSVVVDLEGGAERFDFGWDLEREAFCAASAPAWRMAREKGFDADVEVDVEVVDDGG